MPLLVNLRLLVLVAFTSGALFAQQNLSFRPPDALNPAAFEHFYDMDYEYSIQEFTQISQRHPGDPNALNHLLTAVLFRELYRIGALNAGEYANDSFINTKHGQADSHVCDQIKSLVQQERESEGRSHAVRKGSHSGAVCDIHCFDRTRLVFGFTKRAWSAPRSREGVRSGSAISGREADCWHAQLCCWKPAMGSQNCLKHDGARRQQR